MPTISQFYGIRIEMRYNEKHGPHFHARHAESKAQISIQDGTVLAGRLPGRAYRLVLEWLELHRAEMLANWERVRGGQAPAKIEGLE